MGDEQTREMSPVRGSPRRARASQPPALPTIRSVSSGDPDDEARAPFNFTPAYFSPPTQNALKASKTSQRRGHRYKHSSVSLQFFKEPEARAPLAIPVSRPVPTLQECWQSVTREQLLRLLMCAAKIAGTLVVYSLGSPEMHSVSTLAHVIAYETVVHTTVVVVSVLANFDVWTRSSMRLPFALKRIEVMVAFGLSIVLVFIGGDIISHGIEELVSGHGHAHAHAPETASRAALEAADVVERAAQAAIAAQAAQAAQDAAQHAAQMVHDAATAAAAQAAQAAPDHSLVQHFLPVLVAFLVLVPSLGKTHSTIPLTLPTLALALTILIAPLFPRQVTELIDTVLTPTIAAYMITLGWKGVKMFGSMLAMSYGGADKTEEIRREILADPCAIEVREIGVWQVHYDLWLATGRVVFKGDSSDAERVRRVAERAIRAHIPVENVDWEMTIEVLHCID